MPNSSRAPLSSTGQIRSCNTGMPFIRSHPMATAVPKIDLPDAVRCADRSLACVLPCDYLRWRIKPILTMPLKTGNATPAQFQKTVAFCNCSSHRLSHSALHRFSWMRMHLLMAFPAPARINAGLSTSSPSSRRANLCCFVRQISEMRFSHVRVTLKNYIGKPAQRLKLRRPQAG